MFGPGISVLAVSDTIIDVFQFLRRKELDTLQLLCKRFNAIVVKKLTMVCLRLLWSAKLSHSGVQRQFVLLMGEVGAKKLTRLPTGVDDEPAATTLLLNACRSSRVESLELYGTGALSVEFFDSLALSAPTISLKDLRFGNRTVPDDIPHDRVLRALRSFAELKRAMIVADRKDAILQNCLIRTCFKIGVSLVSNVPVPRDVTFGKCDIAVVEEALLEFSFGVCDDQYAMRERSLYVCFYKKTLKNDFLQRWIEKAEVTDCRHNLTLDIRSGVLLQDTDALQAYKQGGLAELNLRFRSVSGRRWAVTYGNGKIVFEIKH
ncbi:hypothetical protein AAVH_14083 [Aphelenchoides avenae]|nr:hypothetical protein AAVH_14083 [Aphelenchus avenae]